MEIYMLTEHDIPVTKATNYTIQGFLFYQTALVFCAIIAVLYNFKFRIFPKIPFLEKLVLLGFIINIFVIIILLLVSLSKKTTTKATEIIIIICKKINIKIDEKSVAKTLDDYHKGFENLKNKKYLIIEGVILNILSLIFLYIIPFFIIYSMNYHTQINIADTLTSSSYVYLIGAFVPIPGASGGIEYGFTQFFGNFINSGSIGATLLIWRMITYYLGIILGALIFNFERKVK